MTFFFLGRRFLDLLDFGVASMDPISAASIFGFSPASSWISALSSDKISSRFGPSEPGFCVSRNLWTVFRCLTSVLITAGGRICGETFFLGVVFLAAPDSTNDVGPLKATQFSERSAPSLFSYSVSRTPLSTWHLLAICPLSVAIRPLLHLVELVCHTR